MLLISRFRTVLLLLCLVSRGLSQSPDSPQLPCWRPNPGTGWNNIQQDCNSTYAATCAIDAATGLGIGCVFKSMCPSTGSYRNESIVCGVPSRGADPICCCENDPEANGGPSCSNILAYRNLSAELCANDPVFKDSEWCKPKNVCVNPEGQVEACLDQVPLMPYCSADPCTRKPLGCPNKLKKQCPEGRYSGSEMLCQDGNCCCKANSVEPCNALEKLKNLTGCPPVITRRPPLNSGFRCGSKVLGVLILTTGLLAVLSFS